MIFDSVNAISNAKNLQDKYQFEIDQLKTQVQNLLIEKNENNQSLNKTIKDRDQYREEVKEMIDYKNKLEREKKQI